MFYRLKPTRLAATNKRLRLRLGVTAAADKRAGGYLRVSDTIAPSEAARTCENVNQSLIFNWLTTTTLTFSRSALVRRRFEAYRDQQHSASVYNDRMNAAVPYCTWNKPTDGSTGVTGPTTIMARTSRQ